MKLSARTSDHVAVSDREESQSLFDNPAFKKYEKRLLTFLTHRAGKRGLCTRDIKTKWPDPRHERWLLPALQQLTAGAIEAYQCGDLTRYRVKENRPVMFLIDDSLQVYGRERGLA